MRSLLPPCIAGGLLLSCAAGFAGADTAPAPPTKIAASTPAADNDAAAKHAKRTACRYEAKTKKIVGARKDAFINDCVSKP
jgi:hypothetical protein